MAIIKKFTYFQKKKLEDLTPFVGQNAFTPDLIHMPLYFLNSILPLKFKFLKESFSAFEDKKIKGLIELKKEKGNPAKLRVTKLFLKENSYDVGEQLINYSISRYCAYGANSFYIVFDEKLEEMANLFIEGCRFRIGSYETIYKINKEQLENIDKRGLNLCNFKSFKNCQAQDVADIYNASILPHLKPIFEKHKSYFRENTTSGYLKETMFSYTLSNSEEDKLYGYLSIHSINDRDYILDVVLAPSYENYFMDAVYFVINEINKRCKNWNLYVKIKHFFTASNNILEQADEFKFEFAGKNLILVKDFFKPLKQDILQNAQILFSDLNPISR